MARTRRTEQDAAIDAEIGRRVAELRARQQWTLRELGQKVGLSPNHLNALETGKHPFSAALVSRLAMIFNEPVGRLVGEEIPRGSLSEEWRTLFEILPDRDQAVLVDLARKLTNWARSFSVGTARKHRGHSGLIVSFEGIDGLLLERLAKRVKAVLGSRMPAEIVSYDHHSELWQHLRGCFEDPVQSPIQRTLLFACERLLRQETAIRPALHHDQVVLSPFFSMAPSVYQEVDGVGDRRLIDIIDTLVLQPDLIVLVYSSAMHAARAATRGVPEGNQFYSPYSREVDFERASGLYRKATEEFTSHGHTVLDFDLTGVDVRENSERLIRTAESIAAHIHELRDE